MRIPRQFFLFKFPEKKETAMTKQKMIQVKIYNQTPWYSVKDLTYFTKTTFLELKKHIESYVEIYNTVNLKGLYINLQGVLTILRYIIKIGTVDINFLHWLVKKDKEMSQKLADKLDKELHEVQLRFVDGNRKFIYEQKESIREFQDLEIVCKSILSEKIKIMDSRNKDVLLECVENMMLSLNIDQTASIERLDFWILWVELSNNIHFNEQLNNEINIMNKRTNLLVQLDLFKKKIQLSKLL